MYSVNPSAMMYLQWKNKLSSKITQILSLITKVTFKFQVTLLIQLQICCKVIQQLDVNVFQFLLITVCSLILGGYVKL